MATTFKGDRVAVLGAGPMGLGAAYQLALDGHVPVVFEADDRLGGMTASFDFGGLSIERFYHFHCTSDSDFLRVLDELGIAHAMRWTSTKMGYFFGGKVQPWGGPVGLLSFDGISLVDKVRYGAHAFMSVRRNEWRDLDAEDAQVWLKRWVGEHAFEVLWRRLFELKFHHYASNLSAAWIWSRIRRIGRSRDARMRERLGYLDGGSERLLTALRDAILARGGEIRLSTPVKQVVIENGTVVGVQHGDSLEPFDRVVSTIPLPYVPRIFPDLPAEVRAKIERLPYIAVVCVIVKLRRALTENFWLNVNDEAMDIPGLVEYTNLRPLDQNIVYVPYYLPAEHPKYAESDAQFIERVTGYLKTINPSITDADILDARASRYRFAQPICPPRFLEMLPPVKPGVRGLALADTTYYYPEDRGISESLGLGRKLARWVFE